jgi:ribosome-associated toxin RatA of RatAB toxin-antitoxin module
VRWFISYSHDDVTAADAVEGILSSANEIVYRDTAQFGAEGWREKAAYDIRACDYFLLLLSGKVVASPTKPNPVSRPVVDEVNVATDLGKTIVVARLDGSEIPPEIHLAIASSRTLNCRTNFDELKYFVEIIKSSHNSPPRWTALQPDVKVRKAIMASRDVVFRVAADLEHYPEWHTAVKGVEILELDERKLARSARWTVAFRKWIAPSSYVVDYAYDPPSHIWWKARGNALIAEMAGEYEFLDQGHRRTDAMCSLRLKLRILTGVEEQLRFQITNTRLDDLKRQSELLDGPHIRPLFQFDDLPR